METNKAKLRYEEARITTVLLSGADVITTSDTGTGFEDNWENTPPQGWV